MRILLTNDDGIHAEGLAVLERIARTLSDDVWIVAPETDQSGLAHSLTPVRAAAAAQDLRQAFRAARHADRLRHHGHQARSCDVKPDLVLSGVNSGANMADDVTYSGTIAGAIEGTLQGVTLLRAQPGLQPCRWRARRAVGGRRGLCAGSAREADAMSNCRMARS